MSPDDNIHFWLGGESDPPLANAPRWFTKDPALDREIRERFQGALEAATRGELDAWRGTPRGRLALVLLLGQMSRNMFRDTPRAFAQDALARTLANEALAAGDDRALPPVQVGFLLMPFMHAEDLALQRRCVDGFAALRDRAPADLREYFETSLDYARRHEAIIARFGRFPHRNLVLGRTSTGEEVEFLKQPGSSF